MDRIEINGEEYVKASEFGDSEHVCVIADRGWIFEGMKAGGEGGSLKLTGASVVRRWSNGLGIGGLADPGHKGDYTLDYIGDIEVMPRAVLAIIPLRW